MEHASLFCNMSYCFRHSTDVDVWKKDESYGKGWSDTIKLRMWLVNQLDTNCILSRTFAISAALCEVVKVPLLQTPKV